MFKDMYILNMTILLSSLNLRIIVFQTKFGESLEITEKGTIIMINGYKMKILGVREGYHYAIYIYPDIVLV